MTTRTEAKKIIEKKFGVEIPKPTKAEIKEKARQFKIKKKREEQSHIQFNYENISPKKEIDTLEKLKAIIIENFPSTWDDVKACLSTCATISLKNLNGCPAVILVGSPSGEKTTILSFFYGQKQTYISDDFTPKSFVSHSAGVSSELLESVDLLPKLKNKVLIAPELAPLFEGAKDRLIENFAMLTRVLDGEGLNRDSGVHGHRGYTGDYKFAWLGATTPLKASVWNVMGKIGNRLFFLSIEDKNRTDQDYLDMFSGKAYEEKVKVCRGAVVNFLNNLYSKNGIRKIAWDAEGDIFILPEIIRYAKLLSKLRGTLMTWKGEEKGTYEHSFPIIEEPPRAINSLYNLAKGHALINNRNFLKTEDLEIIRRVAFSSMPHDRFEFLKLLSKHEGRLSTSQIEKELNCSSDTALRTMKIFEILGVVTIKNIQIDYSGTGRPMNYIEINDEFQELLEHTHSLISEEKYKSRENNKGSDTYDSVKVEDIIKIKPKNAHTHQQNNAENSLTRENNGVCANKISKNSGGLQKLK